MQEGKYMHNFCEKKYIRKQLKNDDTIAYSRLNLAPLLQFHTLQIKLRNKNSEPLKE